MDIISTSLLGTNKLWPNTWQLPHKYGIKVKDDNPSQKARSTCRFDWIFWFDDAYNFIPREEDSSLPVEVGWPNWWHIPPTTLSPTHYLGLPIDDAQISVSHQSLHFLGSNVGLIEQLFTFSNLLPCYNITIVFM